MEEIDYRKIYFWMFLAMITWAFAWTNAKIINNPPYNISFYNLVFFRFLLGFLSLIPFVALTKKPFPKISDLKYIIIPSILFLMYNIAFFKGTEHIAGKGAVLVTTLNPLITVIIMSLINKGFKKKEVIGVALGILGGIIIMDLYNEGVGAIFKADNIYFVICAITWGVMTVFINYVQKIINPYTFICLCYFLTMLMCIPFTSLQTIDTAMLDFKFYLNFFFVSIGAMSFGTSIYMYYTPVIGPVKASIFIFSVPFMGMGIASIILKEPFSQNIIIGGLLGILSIYIVNRK